jgi:hypothetical protein
MDNCAAHAVDWRARAKSLEAVVEAARRFHSRWWPMNTDLAELDRALSALTPAPSTGKET